ncbi:MAG: ferritin [Candidatus Abyssobacteria bacterium SURF_17]|jgi:ferritin-like protein|uniref:Ferritin n=1 Tax=Candidatus Abyssobacteria bacterium SURF_17 TaxID=2093361 RepID=A0A419EQS7_9BACT|nr:MAG: ferritin [Candidatus Abyssubacteria bacterium SURF_17]
MAAAYHESFEKLSKVTLDLHRAWMSLKEEIEAMDWYQQRIDATNDKELKEILIHNRDEEKEHAAMLMEWVRRKDAAFAKEMKEYLFTDGKPITEIEESSK